jgi:uncharacterized protein YeaO (DUF488 family)
MAIQIKRVYEPYDHQDGYRILVDRLWPRGMKKEDAHIDLWLKEVAPSTELRQWFHKDRDNWTEFVKRYKAELRHNEALNELRRLVKEHKKVTLLYAVKDEEHNHAQILLESL